MVRFIMTPAMLQAEIQANLHSNMVRFIIHNCKLPIEYAL